MSRILHNFPSLSIAAESRGDHGAFSYSPTVTEAWESSRYGVKPRANRDRLELGAEKNIVAILEQSLAAAFNSVMRVTECLTSTEALRVQVTASVFSYLGNVELCLTYEDKSA